jgi:hypothetical protein
MNRLKLTRDKENIGVKNTQPTIENDLKQIESGYMILRQGDMDKP